MSTFRSAQVSNPGGPFSIVESELVEPGRGQVRISIEASGICHTDSLLIKGAFPVAFPLVSGHEIAGRIDVIGEGVERWALGDRVAVGWFGGNCGTCISCRDGDFIHCESGQVPGMSYPGGFAESVIVPATALARIPDALTAAEAAPLGCAGVTTFHSLRESGARPGDLVAILGIGGLGHLGVQFANKMGFETVAIARGADKEETATALGAHHYIDSQAGDIAKDLQALGGAKVVLATAANSDAMSASIDGLRRNGELIVLGAVPEPIQVSPLQIIGHSKTVHGHPSGTSRDVEETMHFAALTGIRPMIETRPLDDIAAAYEKMLSGDARYRMVLTTGK